jgi:hypothetical protein
MRAESPIAFKAAIAPLVALGDEESLGRENRPNGKNYAN